MHPDSLGTPQEWTRAVRLWEAYLSALVVLAHWRGVAQLVGEQAQPVEILRHTLESTRRLAQFQAPRSESPAFGGGREVPFNVSIGRRRRAWA